MKFFLICIWKLLEKNSVFVNCTVNKRLNLSERNCLNLCERYSHGDMMMTTLNRISTADAKSRVDSSLFLLVCIYDDDKFNSGAHLEGGIPMSEFLKLKPDLAGDTDIIFYRG